MAVDQEDSDAPHAIRNLNAVARTLLIPLYIRALESRRPDALLRDPKALELVGRIDFDFSGVRAAEG